MKIYIIRKYINIIVALAVAIIIYVTKNRIGMATASFLLTESILKEKASLNLKTLFYFLIAIVLFHLGFRLSFYLASLYYAPIGPFAFTFPGGLIGGMIEMGSYLIFTLIPLKWIIQHSLTLSLRSSYKIIILCTMIGSFIQGIYNAGWQNTFYV